MGDKASKKDFPVKDCEGIFITRLAAERAFLRYSRSGGIKDFLQIHADGGFTIAELDRFYPPWNESRRGQMAYEEATRDPIFLLQRRSVIVVCQDHPEYRYCDNCEGFHRRDLACEVAQVLSDDDLIENEIAVPVWNTVTVYLTREEASAFMKGGSRDYRVYCVPASGELAEVIKRHYENEEKNQ